MIIYRYLVRFLLVKKCINTYEIKPLRVIFPKASAYVKSYHGEIKWMNFFIKDDDLLFFQQIVIFNKKSHPFNFTMITFYISIMILGIKSAMILKKNLFANTSTIKKFQKPK